MRQMPALIEREAEHRVARLHHRRVRGHVRLGAGMRLHVDRSRAEERFGAFDRERLGDVAPPAAAVVAPTRVPLGVLVREHAADGLHHRGARVVLGGDELDLLDLPATFALDGRVQLWIFALEMAHTPLRMPCVESAVVLVRCSMASICFRLRSCRPPWTFAARYASTMLFASSGPITRSPMVTRFRSRCSTESRADHSLSRTLARIPGILFAATAGPMPEPHVKMPRSSSPPAMPSASVRTMIG